MSRILIYANIGPDVGAGHMMRCLSIAKALSQKGGECSFLLPNAQAPYILGEDNFHKVVLDEQHTWQQAVQIQIGAIQPDCVLVDSYAVSMEQLEEINQLAPVVYMDDFAEQRYSVAGIVNYGVAADEKRYQQLYTNTKTTLLLGTRYTPLRQEFCLVQLPQLKAEPQNVLITVGGADPFCTAPVILEYLLRRQTLSHLTFHAVIGALSSTLPQLAQISAEFSDRVVLHHQVGDMARLMQSCDMAISAGGSTLYELCACGVPSISFAYADNQHPNTKGLAQAGVIPYAGDWRTEQADVTRRFAKYLEQMQPVSKRNRQRKKMQTIADGKGAQRLAAALIENFALE